MFKHAVGITNMIFTNGYLVGACKIQNRFVSKHISVVFVKQIIRTICTLCCFVSAWCSFSNQCPKVR